MRAPGAAFALNGCSYELTANNGPNCLHGGRDFFRNRLWQVKVGFTSVKSGDIMAAYAVESIADQDTAAGLRGLNDNKVTFCLDSPDGDQGFPGNMHIEISYSLPGNGELRIDYKAASDADTPVSFTNHSYFNLNGAGSETVLDHIMQINAEYYSPVNSDLIPAGGPARVDGTPFDFRVWKPLGRDIDADDVQLVFGNGYDHNFILGSDPHEQAERALRKAASLVSPESGIRMDVITDMPDMQLYTANGLDAEPGKDDMYYGRRSAVCLETQFRPDAVNCSDTAVREGCILKAGGEFRSATIYRFSAL